MGDHNARTVANPQETLKATLWLTAISGLTDLALTMLKIVFGYVSDIQSITADGIHSLRECLKTLNARAIIVIFA